jgi:hypothetical protein
MWYGFHPNQEVTKVLCAVLGAEQESRVDDRLFCTPDLTASILDHYGVECEIHSTAHSFFREGPGRERTLTLTQKSAKQKEWWLLVVGADVEYWFNLHPEGSGAVKAFRTDTFGEVEVPLDDEGVARFGPPRRVIPQIRGLLLDSGMAPDVVDDVQRVLDDNSGYMGVPRGARSAIEKALSEFNIAEEDIHGAYRM